ncbi:MBL fold metallo-hydrolase [Acidovorax sp. PRC11]|nr:MBL fold metallo-hydrolase [Acidovorax sp. PRC11]MDT0137874.1 MBL fold metallo-hydrolase [Acidovorax sp. PRC11]
MIPRRAPGFLAAVLASGVALAGCQALGASADEESLAAMQRSPQWRGDRFRNPRRAYTDLPRALLHGLSRAPDDEPGTPVPAVATDPAALAVPPPTGLRVTWFGHSSTLLDIDGLRVLTDPLWSDRASPVEWAGPRRWYPPPIALAQLPRVDAVLISHDHYDHLDRPTVLAMREWTNTFIVPLGVGAHLERWGIPRDRIVELDWWQATRVGTVEVSLVPARHSSGRIDPRGDRTLWGGFVLVGPRHRLYFSGDTGLQEDMRAIGSQYGPFDLALVEAGQYDDAWPDAHLGPEQAVLTAERVGARALLPVHWGLFRLAPHGWTEPVERVLAAAGCSTVAVITPRPGQPVEPEARTPAEAQRWWPRARWSTAAEKPVVSTADGDPAHPYPGPACP